MQASFKYYVADVMNVHIIYVIFCETFDSSILISDYIVFAYLFIVYCFDPCPYVYKSYPNLC